MNNKPLWSLFFLLLSNNKFKDLYIIIELFFFFFFLRIFIVLLFVMQGRLLIAHWPGTKSKTKRHRWVRFRGVLGQKQRSSKWDGGRERGVFCTDELWLCVLCFLRRSTVSDPCNLRRNRSRSYLLPEIGKGSQLKWL